MVVFETCNCQLKLFLICMNSNVNIWFIVEYILQFYLYCGCFFYLVIVMYLLQLYFLTLTFLQRMFKTVSFIYIAFFYNCIVMNIQAFSVLFYFFLLLKKVIFRLFMATVNGDDLIASNLYFLHCEDSRWFCIFIFSQCFHICYLNLKWIGLEKSQGFYCK